MTTTTKARRVSRWAAAALAGALSVAGTGDAWRATAAESPGAAAQAPPADDGAAYRSRFIQFEGRRLHYLEWGTPDRQPFLMLHGFGRSAHTFAPIAAHFAGEYHVIAMDLRGHGESDWHPKAAYTIEDCVKDVEALVEQLGLRNMVLTGNSMGGRLVQVFAAQHPDRVAKLIVEDVGPERPAEIGNALAERVRREREGWASEDELLESLRRSSRLPEALHLVRVRHETTRLPNGRIAWKFDPDFVKGLVPTEIWQYVRRIKAPALYVIGANSNIVPPETREALRRLPNVEVVVLPDAGHYPHQDTPLVYVAVMKAFLAGDKR